MQDVFASYIPLECKRLTVPHATFAYVCTYIYGSDTNTDTKTTAASRLSVIIVPWDAYMGNVFSALFLGGFFFSYFGSRPRLPLEFDRQFDEVVKKKKTCFCLGAFTNLTAVCSCRHTTNGRVSCRRPRRG